MPADLSKTLNLLMAEARINAEELSRRIGLPASTIKKIRNQQDANPTLSTIIPIAKYFSLTISELIGDTELPNSMNALLKPSNETSPKIPLINWQDACLWPDVSITPLKMISTEYLYSKNAYCLLVEEDNWVNLAKDTVLIVDPALQMLHRDFIIVHKKGQSPTLKQALFDEDNIYLKPAAVGYQITLLTPDHKILGVVAEYKKNLRILK